MTQVSPLLAEALADALAVPPGLVAYLARAERDLRAALDRLQALPSPALPLVEELRAEVARALDDREHGALPRILRRPLWQLDTKSPAIRAFGKYLRDLSERVEAAALLQAHADRAAEALAALHDRFAPRLPTLTARLLGEAGVSGDDLRRVRKPADVRVFLARLEHVSARLAELAADLPEQAELLPARAEDGPTVEELWVLLRARRRLRERAQARPARAVAARDETARQVHALSAAAAGEAAEAHGGQLAMEQLAGSALGEPGFVPAGLEVPLWTALVARAAAAVHRAGARPAWRPAVRLPAPPAEPLRTQSTLFVIPIDREWAWITPDTPSPVRLRALSAEAGKAVQARVFAPERAEVGSRMAELDVAPLFDGTDAAIPAWYVTADPARLRVAAAFRGGWFARVEKRGSVRRIDTPAWSEQVAEPGALRLLPPPDQIDAPGGIEVGPAPLPGHAFLGLRTRVVHAPFHRHPTAWLRGGDGSAAVDEALEHERELFAALERRSGARGLRYLARAATPGGAERGILYAAPFALRADGSPVVAAWLRERPLSFVRAVAEALVAVHDTGWVLGVCHRSMFAFSAGYGGREADVRPRALLCYAPFAVPAGRYFAADTGARGYAEYEQLGYGAMLPWLTGAEVALPEIDALAFAVFALDLLPRRPPADTRRHRSWADLVAYAAMAPSEAFEHPRLATPFLAALRDTSQAGAVLEIMRGLAGESRAGVAVADG
ncbi:MAG TPA: hypothetical protein VF092_17120 [Longimicrobium sp.]